MRHVSERVPAVRPAVRALRELEGVHAAHLRVGDEDARAAEAEAVQRAAAGRRDDLLRHPRVREDLHAAQPVRGGNTTWREGV